MNTITQPTNRFSSDIKPLIHNENFSIQSLLWHLHLYKNFSKQDCELLQALTPQNASLFILLENRILFKSENYDTVIKSLKSDMNYSYDASYVQQIETIDNGIQRVLTIPFDSDILIGLITSSNLQSFSEIEDVFMHKVYTSQKKYKEFVQNQSDLNQLSDYPEPLLIINRTDNQILTCNNSFLSFCNLSNKELLELNLQELQKKYPKTSNRKVLIKNCEIAGTECSQVQFTLRQTDKIQADILTDKVKSHTKELIEFYQQVKSNDNFDDDLIDARINNIQKSYQEILDNQYNFEK